ncbi:transposase, partial [Candidatus Uhrbacteria bacterium]|nr:transposase [Candidatus Uhrbacteria bacterium]
MFKSAEGFTNSLFGSYTYDPIIARNADHLLVRMQRLIDWSFVEEEVADCYSTDGRSALHPAMVFKFLIIQKLYDLSEREVMSDTDCHIIKRWFVGLGMNEDVPHWTDLGKFKERIGTERLKHLFYRVLEEAEHLGIVIGKKRIVDATDVGACVDTAYCAKDKQDDTDHDFVTQNTSDPDARFGSKGKGKRGWYGYKSSTNMDAETDL